MVVVLRDAEKGDLGTDLFGMRGVDEDDGI